MHKLTFFTTSRLKLANIRYLLRNHDVEVLNFKEKTYGGDYMEPRLSDRMTLLDSSFRDANRLWNLYHSKQERDAGEDVQLDLVLSNQGNNACVDSESSGLFFIEDTSVKIHAISSDEEEVPGLDIKYWMREMSFSEIDFQLKKNGNNRRVTVRSDILLLAPNEEKGYKHFYSEVDGFLVDREWSFSKNLVYPWLDDKTFNKWFTPLSSPSSKPISMLSVEEAEEYDFRKSSVIDMVESLPIRKKLNSKFANIISSEVTQMNLDFSFLPTFIISGATCAGKTTMARFLTENYGYYHIEASDFMYLAYYMRHGFGSNIDITDFAKEALKCEPEIVASAIKDHLSGFVDNASLPVVISGFRSIREVDWFCEKHTMLNVIKVCIRADVNIRFSRCVERKRSDFSKEKFHYRDKNQHDMGLSALFKCFDKHVVNERTKDVFYSDFKKMFTLELSATRPEIIKKSFSGKGLEKDVLCYLLSKYDGRKFYSTTEIAKGIALMADSMMVEKVHHKDNISRYFNQRFYPYFEIRFFGKTRKYRLSGTGYSFAKVFANSVYR